MSKLSNMLNMINILKDNKIHNINELSKKLEVSPRMIRSYKSELELAGIYIHSIKGIHGGYSLDSALNHIDVGLTDKDISVLNILSNYLKNDAIFDYKNECYEIIQKLNHNYLTNKSIKNLEKLQDIMDYHSHLGKLYKEIRNAILARKKMWIEYNSINTNITQRKIHPAELFHYQQEWYVASFCEKRNEIRLFKLQNILKYKILDETYSEKNHIKK